MSKSSLPDAWEPAQYRETNELLERLNIKPTYIAGAEGTLSVSFRSIRGEYCIAIDPTADTPAYKAADLREKGHILFNHYTRQAVYRRQVEEALRHHTGAIAARVEHYDPSRLHSYIAYLYNRFAAMAQAMEIHTKLFKSDWQTALTFMNRHRRRSSPEAVSDSPLWEAWPRESWPLGLDWISYLDLLSRDTPFFLDLMAEGAGRAMRSGDMSSYKAAERDEEALREQHKKALTAATGSTERFGTGRTTRFTDAALTHRITECADIREVALALRKHSLMQRPSALYTDLLYNVNRNRLNTPLLVPRRYRIERYTPGSVCILLDVSGSIPSELVRRTAKTIAETEGAFDQTKSRLVCWSDGLCGDYPLAGLAETAIPTGGGTSLAAGIAYCARYLHEGSAFFILSDLRDDLNAWISAARGIKGRKTVIAYRSADRTFSLEQWFTLIGSNGDWHHDPLSLQTFTSFFYLVTLTLVS
jgi:hypothetical protein